MSAQAPEIFTLVSDSVLKTAPKSSRYGVTKRAPVYLERMLVGSEIHESIASFIENAERCLDMTFYKVSLKSEAGQQIVNALRALCAKAIANQKAISVRIIYNQRGWIAEKAYRMVGNPAGDKDTGLEALQAELNQSPWFSLLFVAHEAQLMNSFHAKTMIADGRHMMILSLDPCSDNDRSRRRFDTAVWVQGTEIAETAQTEFTRLWDERYKETVKKEALQPAEDKLAAPPHVGAAQAPNRAIYFSSTARLSPTATSDFAPIKTALIAGIKHAVATVSLINPNLNDKDIIAELAKAASRGIRVEIVMGKYHNESTEKHWGGSNHLMMCSLVDQVEQKARKNLHIRWPMNPETYTVVGNREPYTIHGRFTLIDKNLLLIGTSPYDYQAINNSREVDIAFELTRDQAEQFYQKAFIPQFYCARDFFVEEIIEALARALHTIDRQTQLAIKSIIEQLSHPGVTLRKTYLIMLEASLDPVADAYPDVFRFFLKTLQQQFVDVDCSIDPDYHHAILFCARQALQAMQAYAQALQPKIPTTAGL